MKPEGSEMEGVKMIAYDTDRKVKGTIWTYYVNATMGGTEEFEKNV